MTRVLRRIRLAGMGSVVAALLITMTGLMPDAASAATQSAKDPGLKAALDKVLSAPEAKQSKLSMQVADADDGTVLYNKTPGRALSPASNNKLLTASAALDKLGPNYRWHTDVLAPKVKKGKVADLVLKGSGDPTTLQEDYAALAKKVKKSGITAVKGDLVVDTGFFDNQQFNPYWYPDEASEYWSAEISALTIAPNTDYDSGTVIVNYQPTKVGKPAKLSVTPASAAKSVKLINKTKTAAKGSSDSFSVARRTGTNEITLTGKVPAGQSSGRSWVTVSKPQLVAADVFRAELAKAGVTVQGSVTEGTAAKKDTRVARDYSMTLANLVVPFLKLSNNMHAEAIVKTMAAMDGRPGNWGDGTAEVMSYLRRNNIPTKGVVLVDGSGLAAADQLTAKTIIGVLRTAQDKPWFNLFYKALPVAGNPDRWVGGTLKSRMQDTAAANNLCGKTGTINGVTALSGYVTGKDGRDYVFSMLSRYPDGVTESQMKGIEDKVGVAIAGWDAS